MKLLGVVCVPSVSILGDCSKTDCQFAGRANCRSNSDMHQKLRFGFTFLSSSETLRKPKSLPVTRGRSPFDPHQESRLVAGPDFLSKCRVFILYFQSIRFDGKTVNRGDQPRDCNTWCWPIGALPRETRMLEDWVAFVSSYLAWRNRTVNCLCSTTSIPPNLKRLVRPASLIVSSTVVLPMPP